MKTHFKILFLALLFAGCETISENDRYIPLDVEHGGRAHVLLEFTGFRCVNCPAAEQRAGELKEMYGDNLIIVALHPASNPFTQGKYDYTCPEADSIYLHLGGNAGTSFPMGNVDIMRYEGNYFMLAGEWTTMIYQAMKQISAPTITCTTSADKQDPTIVDINVTYSPLEDARVACWLVEDSVLGMQAMEDGSANDHYYHRHVLRAAAHHTPWGIPATGTETDMKIQIPDHCNLAQLSVVALLIDKKDNHIINAYEKKL